MEYYTSLEEGDTDMEESERRPQESSQAGSSGRTLDGSTIPQPVPSDSSGPPASGRPSTQKKKFATLGDLGASSGGHGHEHSDSDDDDKDPQDFFTGGEKSGLAVQNPDDLKKKIVAKAKR